MQTAVITGATGGVGQEIARKLYGNYRLVLLGRNSQKLQDISRQFDAESLVGDLNDDLFVQSLSSAIPECSVLVHAAGISIRKAHDDITPEDWHGVFSTNVFSVARTTSILIPQIRHAKGDIVVINSGAGQFSSAGNALYSASKHALKAYANSMREEERSNGVRVIQAFPGYMDTEMSRAVAANKGSKDVPRGHMVPTATLAEIIFAALTAPKQAMVEEITLRPTEHIDI